MHDAEVALRALIDRIDETKRWRQQPVVAAAEVAGHVFDGSPDEPPPLDYQHGSLLGQRAEHDPLTQDLLRRAYAGLADLEPEVWVRWGRTLEATGGLDQSSVPPASVGRWPFHLLQQMYDAGRHAPIEPPPTMAAFDPVLRAGGTHLGEIVALCFFRAPNAWFRPKEPGPVRSMVMRMPEYSTCVLLLREWLLPHLAAGDLEDRLVRLALLDGLTDEALAEFADEVVALALASSRQQRERAEPLVLRVPDAADAPLRAAATGGAATARAQALRLLHRCGGVRRDDALALARADRAASVRALVEEWESAEAVDEAAAPLAPLPPPDWGVVLDDDVERALAEVDRIARRASTWTPGGSRGAVDVPDDHAQRLREALAAPEPVPVLLDLEPAIARSSLLYDFFDAVGPLPLPASLQVTEAYGLLGGKDDERPRRLLELLPRAHDAGRVSGLLEVEAALDGLGHDGGDLLRRACLHGWLRPPAAHDWPDDEVAPWVARNLEPLLAQHEREQQYAYDRDRFFALLRLIDPPPPALEQWLYARALSAQVTDRAESQALLAGHPEVTPQRVAALGSSKAAVRAVAATWLRDLPDEAALPALEAAVATERHDVARGAMLDALAALGRPVLDYLDLADLDARATAEVAGGLPASLSWLDPSTLPAVHWAQTGRPVARDTLLWLVVSATRARFAEPGALLRTIAGALDPAERTRFGDTLLRAWADADQPAAAKGVVAVVAATGGADAVATATRLIRTHHGRRAAQSKALVAMLGASAEPQALVELTALAHRFQARSVQEAAAVQVAAVAERRGWTLDELTDRTVPTAGLDDDGRLALDYGDRRFLAVLQPDLGLAVFDDTGKALTGLPAARAADDPERVAAAKAELKAARATLKATGARQTERMHEAMTVQRAWSVDDWQHDLAAHPVVSRLASRAVWVVETDDGLRTTFRPLDDGTLTDADDEPVELPTPGTVRLAHAATLTSEERTAWRRHLADYEVAGLLDQVAEPPEPLDAEQLAGDGLDAATGTRLTAGALDRTARARGYLRGAVGDGAGIDDYVKDLPALGLTARLGLARGTFLGDGWDSEVEVGELVVEGPAGPVRVGDLPPVLVVELRRDLEVVAGAGTPAAVAVPS